MKTDYHPNYISKILKPFRANSCLDEFKNNIIHSFNKLYLEEPFTEGDILEFMAIYDQPLVYSDVGLNIDRHHTFREMWNNPKGKSLVEMSFVYKRAQWLYEAIYDSLHLYETIQRRRDLIPILKNVFLLFKNNYEKQIFERYYQYYKQFT